MAGGIPQNLVSVPLTKDRKRRNTVSDGDSVLASLLTRFNDPGIALPPLNLAEVLKKKHSKDRPAWKAQSCRISDSSRRRAFGEWYLPPNEWNKLHTARSECLIADHWKPIFDSVSGAGQETIR